MKFSTWRYSKGWMYMYLQPFLHLTYRVLFQKIYIHNSDNVPAATPVLLAVNHPTAFIDPITLCLFLDPPLYNMTRGDIFRKPLARRILEDANMFPVFRMRDGYTERNRNDDVFEFCVERLKTDHVVTIYVEGEHHLEKRLRPSQKGLARIAFATYERYKQDNLMVIPVGCNYHVGDRLRDTTLVEVGTPLYIKDYWEDYEKSSAAAINRLCNDINRYLEPLCYHIADPEDDILAEQLLTLLRSEKPAPMLPVVEHSGRSFAREKSLLNRLNVLENEQKEVLRAKTGTYFNALDKNGLLDEALVNPGRGNWLWLLFFAVAFIPFLIGLLPATFLLWLGHKITRSQIKKREFFSSVLMGVLMFSSMIVYGILLIAGLMTLHPIGISLALLLPLLGWFSILYREIAGRWLAARKAKAHPERGRLLQMREEIAQVFTLIS